MRKGSGRRPGRDRDRRDRDRPTMGFFELDPIKALVLSAIINGVISVPIMVVLMMIGQSKRLLGRFTISARHRVLGWAATVVMAAAVLFMLVTAVL